MQTYVYSDINIHVQCVCVLISPRKTVRFMWLVLVTMCARRNKRLTWHCGWSYPFYDTTVFVLFYLLSKGFMVVNIFSVNYWCSLNDACDFAHHQPKNHKEMFRFFWPHFFEENARDCLCCYFHIRTTLKKRVLYKIVLHAMFSKVLYSIEEV